ncbi:MAG: Cytochrome c family protein [Nitrospira sp.]|nr:MAG: Cytochrome c family protein [Nitrospira sp.]
MRLQAWTAFLAVGCLIGLGGCTPTPKAATVSAQGHGGGGLTSADMVFAPPSPEMIPGDWRGEQIRLGYTIVVDTQEYGRPYVGNRLNCTNCHLNAGLNPNAASFVGISRLYPEYRARADRQMTLADRINECFERSMNGHALSSDSSKLQAVVAYIEWLSQNVPPGNAVPWRGIPRLTSTHIPDVANGQRQFAVKCALCHGADGQGTMAAPPVWGPQSYTIAAGMARVSVAASFIKSNMPRGLGWTLTDEEAVDVAAYVNSQPRPDFPGKARDWPKGGKPADVPY